MKNRTKLQFFVGAIVTALSCSLNGWEGHDEDPHYEWFEGHEVAINEEGVYADSNKGMLKLNVVEYDSVNDRYKVLCRCRHLHGYDLTDALSVPYAD